MGACCFDNPFQLFFLITAAVFGWIFPKTLQAQSSLPHDTLHLSEVEVIGKAGKLYPILVIPSLEMKTVVVRDIGDFLRKEPNVSGIRKGGIGIDPVVRGFKYNQVSVVLNSGVRIEGGCPNRMDPTASHVESENIQKIELLKGPYVLKYGPVLGALINLETVQPRPCDRPEIHGSFLYGFETNWNGQREHLTLSGGNRFVFFNASAGYKGYGSYRAGNQEIFSTSFNKLYGTAAIGFLLSPNHQLILDYSYNQGKNVMYPALPMDERTDQTHVAIIRYTGKNPGKTLHNTEIQGYFSAVHHVMDNLNRPTASLMQAVTTVDSRSAGGKFTGQFTVGKQRFLIGGDYEHVYKDGDKKMTMKMIMEEDTFVSVKYANVWLNASSNNAALFAEYKIPVTAVEWMAALRLDYNQAASGDTFRLVREGVAYFDDLTSGFFNVSFSLGIKKQLTGWLSLRASLGKGSRSPSLLERYIKLMPVQYDAYDYLGNPQLKPEDNYQADVAFDITTPELGLLSVGGFFSWIRNYIIGKVLPPSLIKPSTQGAPGVKQFSNTDGVYLTGFELSWQSPAGKQWEVVATAAATYGVERQAVKYIVSGGQVVGQETVKNDPLPEIPPLEGSISFSWKFFRDKLIPGATIRLVSPQYRISQSYGEQNTPGFVTAALSVSYKPCRFATLSGGINNLFDNPYYEHLNRRMVGSTIRLYEPGRVFYCTVTLQF